MTYKRTFFILVAVSLAVGCENARNRETGALTGGTLGAGLGAIIGHQTGHAGAGVAIGGALGALSGALVGNSIDNTNDALDARDQQISDQEREIQENRRLLEALKARGADARTTDRGVVVNLPDVLFDFDSARLTSAADDTARDIAEVLRSAGDRSISVEGHTDSVGTVEYNLRLSEDRARSVANALMSHGVPRRLLTSRGFGESHPVASNQSESGRARNRRVEVVIKNH